MLVLPKTKSFGSKKELIMKIGMIVYSQTGHTREVASKGITINGIAPGMNYEVFTSTNLTNWTTTGVTVTAPDAEGIGAASISATANTGFLRLHITEDTP